MSSNIDISIGLGYGSSNSSATAAAASSSSVDDLMRHYLQQQAERQLLQIERVKAHERQLYEL
jgi:hypothetical protein